MRVTGSNREAKTPEIRQTNSLIGKVQQGEVLRGRVISISQDNVLVKLINGETIVARVEGSIDLEPGLLVDFEVLERSPSQIRLKPMDLSQLGSSWVIGSLMEKLNIVPAAGNKGILYYMLLQGLPLTQDNLDFFLKRRYRISMRFQVLLEKAKCMGLHTLTRRLEDCFPSLADLPAFLANIDDSIEEIEPYIFRIYQSLSNSEGDQEVVKTMMGQILEGMLMQTDTQLPFRFFQIPLKAGRNLCHSELWLDKDKDKAFIELEMPNMGTVGCMIVGWKSRMDVDLYCHSDFYEGVNQALPGLKEMLKSLNFRVGSIRVFDNGKSDGLFNFLSCYPLRQHMLDIRV